jgi:hypothetical protein
VRITVKKWLFLPAAIAATSMYLAMVAVAAPQDGPAPVGRGTGQGSYAQSRSGRAGATPE